MIEPCTILSFLVRNLCQSQEKDFVNRLAMLSFVPTGETLKVPFVLKLDLVLLRGTGGYQGGLVKFTRDMLLSEAWWVHGWDLASTYVLHLL